MQILLSLFHSEKGATVSGQLERADVIRIRLPTAKARQPVRATATLEPASLSLSHSIWAGGGRLVGAPR